MFTGIIQTVGLIRAIEPHQSDCSLIIALNSLASEVIELGDSIAVNGVCLTAVSFDNGAFRADVSRETLDCTTVGGFQPGHRVNLELAMRPQDRLGGHLVSGHVDGVGEVVRRWPDGNSERFRFKAPSDIARYIAAKGSVCIDGTSLTVNAVEGDEFDVNIVPHTLENTVIGGYASGSQVNLEVDVVARYIERLLSARSSDQTVTSSITEEMLSNAGFGRH